MLCTFFHTFGNSVLLSQKDLGVFYFQYINWPSNANMHIEFLKIDVFNEVFLYFHISNFYIIFTKYV